MEILIGHLIGDYVLQTDWMASNKKRWDLIGWLSCIIHCLVWTLSISFMVGFKTLDVIILLFLSHLIIDKTNIVKFYLNTFRIMPEPDLWKIIIVDNTFHLLIVYWLIN